MLHGWTGPSVQRIHDAPSSPAGLTNFLEVPEEHEWVYVLIVGSGNALVDHPIHLHGHDFYILAHGRGTWNESLVNLNNPPRRDTAMLYGKASYLVLAWKADNPESG